MHYNFLLVSWGTSGNLSPLLTAGRQLRRNGHRVRVMADPAMRPISPSISPGQRMGLKNMRYVILAAVTALAVGGAVTAHAASERSPFGQTQQALSGITPDGAGNSITSLNALLAEWDQAGFSTPSKPSQYRVYGRNGHVTNGGGYNYMVSLIRSAMSDVREGRDRDAATKITEAERLLAPTKITEAERLLAPTNQMRLARQ